MQSERNTYCMIPFLGYVQKGQTYADKRRLVIAWVWEWKSGFNINGYEGFYLGYQIVLKMIYGEDCTTQLTC